MKCDCLRYTDSVEQARQNPLLGDNTMIVSVEGVSKPMRLANPIKLIKRNQLESRKVVRGKRCLTSQSKGMREGALINPARF